ncbi:hypothetical protein BDP55DRAFT_70525 [Colletotrichum godetiae]|uniref:Uncharacterized protein n=1 Tax=Colletotrichum godetiae TaxID=1209918 RepID=A0AAJ0AQF3_9PEZI|nr:uncharacterized protein BDP55DRAFT_70525 [Colletotrichum godetiae]KAK1687848.1 hypothetical protein BDP55DRAFT_70525 [Colletotrichum godetiae]
MLRGQGVHLGAAAQPALLGLLSVSGVLSILAPYLSDPSLWLAVARPPCDLGVLRRPAQCVRELVSKPTEQPKQPLGSKSRRGYAWQHAYREEPKFSSLCCVLHRHPGPHPWRIFIMSDVASRR